MARALTSGFITEATATSNRPAFFFEGSFAGLTLRLWSGTGVITWNGNGWNGNGWFQGFQGIDETDDLGSTGMDILLMGVPQALISTMLGSAMQGAPGKLWIGFLDSAGAVIADPYLAFVGRMDVPTIDDQVDGPIIQISYESKLIELDRAKEYRYTTESQKLFNPNDMGFNHVIEVQSWKGQWGAKKEVKKKNRSDKTRNVNRYVFPGN